MPRVEVDLIDRPDQPTFAAGEPTPCAIPAAIGNAVFDATGVRLREVPFTPERALAALAAFSAFAALAAFSAFSALAHPLRARTESPP